MPAQQTMAETAGKQKPPLQDKQGTDSCFAVNMLLWIAFKLIDWNSSNSVSKDTAGGLLH